MEVKSHFRVEKYQMLDNDLLDTALRETKEETGLEIFRDNVIGQLKQVITLNSGIYNHSIYLHTRWHRTT